MKNTFINKMVKIVSFVLCASILFALISKICERKTNQGAWNYMAKLNEFYSLDEDSLDYIGVGSSHMYCSINPLEVWKESGASGFVLATQQQPLVASYHYIKEAFKTQSPKYVVLEGLMIGGGTDYDSAVLYDAIDPLKFSMNKIQMINSLVGYEQRPEYYFNILKYHTRWSEVTISEIKEAFENPTDNYRGFVALDGDYEGKNMVPDYKKSMDVELSEFNLQVLNKIHDLTSQNGAQLILMIAPYDAENPVSAGQIKAGIKWAEEKGVSVLDYALMLDEIGINPKCDYYDEGHLDVSGAAKVSSHFGKFLMELGVPQNKIVEQKKWQSDYDKYVTTFKEELREYK